MHSHAEHGNDRLLGEDSTHGEHVIVPTLCVETPPWTLRVRS